MAGVKGKSGGARPGAGRKPKKPARIGDKDMLEFLQDVATGKIDATELQVRAAIAAVRYTHAKAGENGKKAAKNEAAKVAAMRFASVPPPKLQCMN